MALLQIERLGQRGEGIAAGPVYVPYTLPCERVEAVVSGDRALPSAILQASPDRVAPGCPLFGTCGGCAMQMMRAQAYQDWKRGLVVAALQQARIDAPVAPLRNVHGAGRRRATFHARMVQGRAECGFMQARTHDIVTVDHCPILAPSMAAAPRVAQEIAQALAHRGKPLDLVVTASLHGLDVDLRGAGALGETDLRKLTRLAATLDLARLSNHGTVVVEQRPVEIAMGGARVRLPPGGFLQATEEAEAALAAEVLAQVQGAGKVADLFCGVGTFALRLAQDHAVLAAESDGSAVAALQAASRQAGLRKIDVERRDLFQRPLQSAELKDCDAVVLDPPRAGAEAQARELARGSIGKLVSVSCHVPSFARDARLLIEGGYRLDMVIPFDQFLYSAHVELIGVFSKAQGKTKRRLFG